MGVRHPVRMSGLHWVWPFRVARLSARYMFDVLAGEAAVELGEGPDGAARSSSEQLARTTSRGSQAATARFPLFTTEHVVGFDVILLKPDRTIPDASGVAEAP